ncbi:MAG: hypothetical protein K8T91_15800, partial [Planctomycetes bacterium]|nr:hypothetical protein [Planctomycetota bacterium]
MRVCPLAMCWISLILAAPLLAEEGKEQDKGSKSGAPVSYYKQIRPIFQSSCFGCHQPAQAKGGLVMTSHAGLLKGGESGDPGVVPNHPEQGTLVSQITPVGKEPAEMPKEGAPLSADQVALVRRWVLEGAKDDSPAADAVAFTPERPPHYVAAPVITSVAVSPDGKLLAVA